MAHSGGALPLLRARARGARRRALSPGARAFYGLWGFSVLAQGRRGAAAEGGFRVLRARPDEPPGATSAGETCGAGVLSRPRESPGALSGSRPDPPQAGGVAKRSRGGRAPRRSRAAPARGAWGAGSTPVGSRWHCPRGPPRKVSGLRRRARRATKGACAPGAARSAYSREATDERSSMVLYGFSRWRLAGMGLGLGAGFCGALGTAWVEILRRAILARVPGCMWFLRFRWYVLCPDAQRRVLGHLWG